MNVLLKAWSIAILAIVIVLGQASNSNADLLVKLKASDYSAATGTWKDSSGKGNDATNSDNMPALATGATPNGSSAVKFGDGSSLKLTHPIDIAGSAHGYTIVAYLSRSTGFGAIVGAGADGGFQYRLKNTQDKDKEDVENCKQNVLRTNVAEEALGKTTIAANTFYSLSVCGTFVGDAAGTSFRVNGADDGTKVGASAPTADPVTDIGGGGDPFEGSIAEIRIYNEKLTTEQLQAIEAEFTASYVAAKTKHD